VLYEVLQVSEQVSVILWSYHQRCYQTFCLLLSTWVVQTVCAPCTSCLVHGLVLK